MSVRQPQQGQRLRQRRHCGPGRQTGRWQWVELEGGRRDDAQGTLGADHQVAQVVAGVVLAKPRQAFPNFPLSVDHFEPQAELAGIAVAQHLGAAGIGAQIAANGAAALSRQAERK